MDGEALVRRARMGHGESREALARAWLGRAYAVALAVTGRAHEAEEVTQEAFLRAFRALPRLRDPSRFGPWLLRIVRNAAKDHFRRSKARVPLPEDLPAAVGEGNVDGVVEAWRRLPDDQRLVVWLRVVDGMGFREIAALLGSSKSSVDRTFRRALARLRKEVSRC